MATSSITENFRCDDAKAANAVVRLLFSATPPKGWQRAPTGDPGQIRFASETERRAHVRRMKRLMSRRMSAKSRA